MIVRPLVVVNPSGRFFRRPDRDRRAIPLRAPAGIARGTCHLYGRESVALDHAGSEGGLHRAKYRPRAVGGRGLSDSCSSRATTVALQGYVPERAAMRSMILDVRFTPVSDRTANIRKPTLSATTGLMRCSKRRSLFDYLVGDGE
jgi:hypothetical protein